VTARVQIVEDLQPAADANRRVLTVLAYLRG